MSREFVFAEQKDAEEFHHFLLRAYASDLKVGIHFVASEATLEDVTEHLKYNLCFLMKEEGKIIASCSLRMPWGKQPGPFGLPHIGWLSADPDRPHQGIGGEMLSWTEDHVLRDLLKAPAVTLGTAKEHPWLCKMYQSRGYVPIKTANLDQDHTTVFFRKDLMEAQ